MRKVRRIISVFMALCMICAMSVFASAEEAAISAIPDYGRKGSVTVDIISTDTGKAIAGGKLTLYKVAEAVDEDGNNIFRLTKAFKESGVELEEITESDSGAEELASRLEAYVNSHKLAGETVTVDDKGKAVWKDLELGLYLIVNTTAAEGYAQVNTFLISVPRYLDGSYVYDVTASPKMGTADKLASTTPNPKPAVSGGKLPQTGQLWWPVPVMAIVGMLFVMFGWYRRRRFGEK